MRGNFNSLDGIFLRSYIEAMGGELEIVARFPDGNVKIKQFTDLDQPRVGDSGAKRACRLHHRGH